MRRKWLKKLFILIRQFITDLRSIYFRDWTFNGNRELSELLYEIINTEELQ